MSILDRKFFLLRALFSYSGGNEDYFRLRFFFTAEITCSNILGGCRFRAMLAGLLSFGWALRW
jgi:hypothetical protein